MSEAYILAARRTPFGKFWGALKDISAPRLGAAPIRRILEETGVAQESIGGVYMGEVLTAGVGQNPARQAALYAGLSDACDARTFGKVCSSSLIALDHAVDKILLGKADLMIAGGMESMSRAPYLFRRWEKRMGDFTFYELVQEFIRRGADEGKLEEYEKKAMEFTGWYVCVEKLLDSMIYDGLCDIYGIDLPHMGKLADMCAREHGISRNEQEAYAFTSFSRALEAECAGLFDSQIVHVDTPQRMVVSDEGIYAPDRVRWKKSKPVFTEDGTVIAGTSSQVSDGAGALLLGTSEAAETLRIAPLARIAAFSVHSQEPEWYTTAPVGAIQKVLRQAGLRLQDIDLFEINEAFAVVPLYAMRELNIPHEKVNIWGGAIAIGHPIGASGARIAMNLAYQLIHANGRYGIAVACNGGGEAVAVLIENVQRNQKV